MLLVAKTERMGKIEWWQVSALKELLDIVDVSLKWYDHLGEEFRQFLVQLNTYLPRDLTNLFWGFEVFTKEKWKDMHTGDLHTIGHQSFKYNTQVWKQFKYPSVDE